MAVEPRASIKTVVAAPALPAKIEMIHAHGFIDENGTHRYWKGGVIVSDPAEIALLTERKANFKAV